LIVDEPKFRLSDGASYSVFHTARDVEGAVGDLAQDAAGKILDRLKRETATVLELAATIHWLKDVECINDWSTELRERKGSKTECGRQDKAVQLLTEIGLFS